MTDTTADPQAYDGCRRACRQARAHTLISGECEHATEPEPTVSLSRVYTATDGHPAIGFDVYTEEQVADLIQPAVGSAAVARAAAHAIVHRHDEPKPAPAAVSSAPAAVSSAPAARAAEERLSRVHEWVTSEVVTAQTEFGNGYRAAQRDIRDLIKGRFDNDAANELRRMADEAQPAEVPEAQDGEAEKLAKARRMAKAFSAPPVAPPEWDVTKEWPMRHKRARDRRVHATAPFSVNGIQRIWTACGKQVGEGGYPLSHMPVDCRDCSRVTTAVEAQQPETQAENPARIDGLRPEFTDHASVESIDVQLQRARSQLRRWHLRVEWLISLRQARLEQKERGEWPAAVSQPAEARQADTAGEQPAP